jgi:hypothetical protein
VINRGKLFNVRLGASVEVTDTFLLGGISPAHRHRSQSMNQRLASLLTRVLVLPLAVLLVPLLLARLLAGKWPASHSLRFAVTPAAPDEVLRESSRLSCLPAAEALQADGWRHFWLVFVPGLTDVMLGKLSVVGPQPRTAAELRALPEDWRNFCLQCPPGLISESFVLHGPNAEEELQFMSDAMHAATADWRSSLRIACRYAALLSLGRPNTAETGAIRRFDG